MKVRNLLSALLVLLLLLSLTACGAGAPTQENAAADKYYDAPAEGAPEFGRTETGSASATALPADRKLIRTIRMDAETEDLTALLDGLTARIAELGGYVETKEQYNGSAYSGYRRRNLSVTVRIPADKADEFVAQVGKNANVVSSSETVEDVTLQYVDTESQVKALETEQERLMELLAQAESLDDILLIEGRLTDVRYELERYASYLRTLENQISYATVYIDITEVTEYTPVGEEEPTAWERIVRGFSRSIRNIGKGVKEFFIGIIIISPYLVILGLIIATPLLIVFRGRGKKQRKQTPPPEKTE